MVPKIYEFEVPAYYGNRDTGLRCASCDKKIFIGERFSGVKKTFILERLFGSELLQKPWCLACLATIGKRFAAAKIAEDDTAGIEAFWASELMSVAAG